jgi:hypothetical protein
MKNPSAVKMAEDISAHLEYFGYKVENTHSEDPVSETLLASHSSKDSIFIYTSEEGYRLVGGFPVNKYAQSHRHELLEFLNSLNCKCNMKFIMRTQEGNVNLAVDFSMNSHVPYDRKSFAKLMESWYYGVQAFYASTETPQFFTPD